MRGPLAVKLNSFRIHRAKLKAVQTWLNGRSLKSPPPPPPPTPPHPPMFNVNCQTIPALLLTLPPQWWASHVSLTHPTVQY